MVEAQGGTRAKQGKDANGVDYWYSANYLKCWGIDKER